MDPLFDVSDQVVAITGGTGVLGSVMAIALAQRGAKVAIIGRSEQKAQAVLQRCGDVPGELTFVQADMTNADSCHQAADSIVSQFGKLDALVNGAGGNVPEATTSDDRTFFDLPPEALSQVMDLNVLGTVLPSQVFGQRIVDGGQGSIINISSMAAMRPLTKVIGYSASKAAITNFTQWLSVYMCQKFGEKIRVNAIAPGFFLTEQNRFLLTDKQTGELTPRGKSIVDHTPMGRFGNPEDLIGALMWLVSPASKFVTGIVVPVDGGFSAFSGV